MPCLTNWQKFARNCNKRRKHITRESFSCPKSWQVCAVNSHRRATARRRWLWPTLTQLRRALPRLITVGRFRQRRKKSRQHDRKAKFLRRFLKALRSLPDAPAFSLFTDERPPVGPVVASVPTRSSAA